MASDEYRSVRQATRVAGPQRRAWLVTLVPAAGIAASEGLLFAGHTEPALWGHLLVLVGCLVAPLWLTSEIRVFRAFALVSCFRLVNLGMPVFVDLTIYWFPLIYGPFVPALYLLARAQEGISLRLDPAQTLLALPAVLLGSAALAQVEYWIIRPDALIPTWSLPDVALVTVVMIGFVGLVEELLYRGVLQRTLVGRYGRWPGILGASALFGLMHSGYGVAPEILFAATIGVVYGLLYERTDNLALVSVLHGLMNVFLFAVIPAGPLGSFL